MNAVALHEAFLYIDDVFVTEAIVGAFNVKKKAFSFWPKVSSLFCFY